jgi:hypothetical protein
MADFFKGLAGGFQTGLQFSDAMRRRQEYEEQQAEREQLRGIFTGQPTVTPGTAATPEQIRSAGLETGRMQMQDIADFGLSAQEAARYAPQMPSETATTTPTMYSYGGLTRQTPFTPAEVSRMQMEQAIPVLAARNPSQALQMRETLLRSERETAAAQRAADLFPLQMEQTRGAIAGQGLSQRQTKLQIEDAERKAASQERVDRFMQAFNADPTQDPMSLARQMNLSLTEQYSAAQTLTGITDQEMKQTIQSAERAIRTQPLAGVVEQFNRSQIFGPGQNFVLGEGPNGSITLTTINTATGRPVGAPETFRTEAEAKGVLLDRVRDPVKAAENALNVRFVNARIDAAVRQGDLDKARIELINMQKDQLSPFPKETMETLNDLSDRIQAAREAGNDREASALNEQWGRVYNQAAAKRGALIRPPAAAAPRAEITLSDAEKIAWGELVKSDQWKMAQDPAARARLARQYGLDPAKLNLPAMPSPTTPKPAPTPQPGLTRPSGTQNLQSMAAGPERMPQDERSRRIQEEADMRGLARDEERAIRRAQVDELGLTAAEVPARISPERARILRNSEYFELFPRDVQRALTEQSGMSQRNWENRSR